MVLTNVELCWMQEISNVISQVKHAATKWHDSGCAMQENHVDWANKNNGRCWMKSLNQSSSVESKVTMKNRLPVYVGF